VAEGKLTVRAKDDNQRTAYCTNGGADALAA
jgi:hypothetical protein